MRSRAFTMTELLVVLAIVAILIVLLIPGISRFIESGRSAKCVANLRQIGAGINLVMANGAPMLGAGYYPALNYHDGAGRYGTWYLAVADELGLSQRSGSWTSKLKPTADIFICPSNAKISRIKQLGADGLAMNNISYGYHDTGMGSYVNRNWRDENLLNSASVTDASKLIMVTDSNGDGDFDYQVSNWKGDATMPGDRHRSGANVLFADGHVEWVDRKKFTWGPILGGRREGLTVDDR